jgi:metal-responsive CopG/Arc/MetJ family transcriptional regulator
VRLQPPLLAALDRFVKDEKRDISRPEAIRELLAEHLIGLGILKLQE